MEPNYENLTRMYLEEKKSSRDIALICGISQWTILRNLKKWEIPIRSIEEGRKLKTKSGEEHWHWQGGKVSNRGIPNYFYIHKPDHPFATKQGYVMEHRLVMEQKLGRFLEPGEIIHHINGDGKDNRPENLDLISRSTHVHNHFAKGKYVMQLEEKIRNQEKRITELEEEIKILKSGSS